MRGNAQIGDTVLYDEQEWTVEARYRFYSPLLRQGCDVVDIRDSEGWHMSEVPAWNVRVKGEG
jgi:hypothetical protein